MKSYQSEHGGGLYEQEASVEMMGEESLFLSENCVVEMSKD